MKNVQGLSLHCAMSFFKKSKKRFTVKDCDWSHLKEFRLEQIILEFHWYREITS